MVTYKFDEGGIHKVRVSVALRLSSDDALPRVNVTVKPYIDTECKPAPYQTKFGELNLHEMANNWKFVEVEYTVGPLPRLGCQLAKYVEISFFAPENSDLQIMAIKLIGDGSIGQLRELENPGDDPDKESGILQDNLIVWVLIGVGVLLLLILVILVWCCCLGTVASLCCSCCGSKDGVRHWASNSLGLQYNVLYCLPMLVKALPLEAAGRQLVVSLVHSDKHSC